MLHVPALNIISLLHVNKRKNTMKTYLTLVTFVLLSILSIQAKQTRFYGSNNLSCNLITSICQDGDGFIWIGTTHGLNKLDGWEFSSYYSNENDSTSLSSSYIHCLYKDSENTLWIGTNNGLQYYLPYENSFLSIQFPNGAFPTIKSIIELHNGEIWITTSGSGVFSVDKKNMRAHNITKISEVSGTSGFGPIYQDRSNSIWLPLAGQRVLRIIDGVNKTYQVFNTPASVSFSDFVEDSEGRLFASTYGEVYQWEPVNRIFIKLTNTTGSFMSPKMIHAQNGVIYISSYGQGLRYIDNESMEIRNAEHINVQGINLNNTKISSLFEDRDGNIWIGCYQKGILMIMNEEPFFNYLDFSTNKQVPNVTISAFYKDSAGQLWVGANEGRLMVLHADGEVKSIWQDGISDISYIFEDSNHNFWIGRRYGGTFLIDKRTHKLKSIPQLLGLNVSCIIEGPDGNIYFSLFGEGLMIYNVSSDTWRLITDATLLKGGSRLVNKWINMMIKDSKGRIWLGHNSGLSCYDIENECFIDLGDISVLDKIMCYSLLEDTKGNIWLGTNHGLYKYNIELKDFSHYPTDEEQVKSVICGLCQDKSGNIWCSTFKGIRKVSPESGKVVSYLLGNGLLEKEYTRGIYFQADDGEIYFSSVHGITHFNPEDIYISGILEEPVLTGLYLNNQPVRANALSNGSKISRYVWLETPGLSLSHKDNTFSLAFSTMNYRAPENISYEYRIRETEDRWVILPQGMNRITYNNLPAGKYTLEVKANENGVYSPVRSLGITIRPPWYLSIPMRIGYALIILACIAMIFYWQYKRLKKRRREEINEEKMKFFINISHEIRSPMTLIISPLSMMLKKDYDEMTTKAIHSMYKNANRILTLINQMLDIRKIDKGQMRMTFSETELVSFIREVIDVFEYHANERKINLSFTHSINSLPVWIDRNNFDKVLVNLIGNALKFTGENGQVELLLTTGEDAKATGSLCKYVEIQITDSGVGLDEKTIDRIFERFYQDKANAMSGSGIGLNLCKTLVELHHGTITASNRPDDTGSCFTIRVPLGNAHLSKEEMVEQDDSPRVILSQNQATERIVSQKKLAVKSKTRNRVLIIDDSEELLLYLKEELDVIYKVNTCNNAADGLRMALELKPDLIISDVVMPGIDGFELLRKIKSNANISHIPVILLTSKTEYDNRIMGWDKGADAILTKPFNLEELILITSNLISNRLRLKGKFSGVQDQKDKAKPVEVKSNDEDFMERVMATINKNMDNALFSVEILAREVGISRVQLHRKLKELAGMSSSEFIRNIRLRHAVELLKSKKINISQAGYMVGYNNPALFSIAFKKYYGVSPSEFCEKNEAKEI